MWTYKVLDWFVPDPPLFVAWLISSSFLGETTRGAVVSSHWIGPSTGEQEGKAPGRGHVADHHCGSYPHAWWSFCRGRERAWCRLIGWSLVFLFILFVLNECLSFFQKKELGRSTAISYQWVWSFLVAYHIIEFSIFFVAMIGRSHIRRGKRDLLQCFPHLYGLDLIYILLIDVVPRVRGGSCPTATATLGNCPFAKFAYMQKKKVVDRYLHFFRHGKW